MHSVIRLAQAVRETYDIQGLATEPEVDLALRGQGLRIVEDADLPVRVRGALYVVGEDDLPVCLVRKGLSTGYRCAVKAHELGHFLLHPAEGLFYGESARELVRDRREHEAQVFAGALLIGSPRKRGFDERLHAAYDDGYPLDFLFSYTNALILASGGMAYPDDEAPPYPIAALDRYDVDLAGLTEPVDGEYRVPALTGC